MTKSPRKPFNLISKTEDAPLREKDNAGRVHQPKLKKSQPAPNLAPTGSKGIREGLPPKEPTKSKRFAIEKPGELKRTFKPIAAPSKEKDRARDH